MYHGDDPKGLRARWPTQQVGAFRAGLRASLPEKAGFLAVLRASPPIFLLARSSLLLATFSRLEEDGMLSEGHVSADLRTRSTVGVDQYFFGSTDAVRRFLAWGRQPKRDLHKYFGWRCVGRASRHQQRFKTRHVRQEFPL
jgi:hypothetical protein